MVTIKLMCVPEDGRGLVAVQAKGGFKVGGAARRDKKVSGVHTHGGGSPGLPGLGSSPRGPVAQTVPRRASAGRAQGKLRLQELLGITWKIYWELLGNTGNYYVLRRVLRVPRKVLGVPCSVPGVRHRVLVTPSACYTPCHGVPCHVMSRQVG